MLKIKKMLISTYFSTFQQVKLKRIPVESVIADIFDYILYLVAEILVFLHQLLSLSESVNDGGVVSSRKFLSYILHRKVGYLTNNVNRRLSRCRNSRGSVHRAYILRRNLEITGGLVYDAVDDNRKRLAVAQYIADSVFRD